MTRGAVIEPMASPCTHPTPASPSSIPPLHSRQRLHPIPITTPLFRTGGVTPYQGIPGFWRNAVQRATQLPRSMPLNSHPLPAFLPNTRSNVYPFNSC
ncbi:Hypothetical protein NTJ_01005 [Nesidiocoris tenuis]|uniref:Uncharacterized protein n=1 Tax=Nesidiocoris tenuis TaxID=355587 RepID=A0ABN7AAM3_9HEMI|nr:Hypothetical protein NTJ_01005 [Nesidiocoris tenuis]